MTNVGLESIKPRETFHQRLRVGRILNQEKDPLGLSDAEVEIRTFNSQKNLLYSILFSKTPFSGSDLISLLTHAKPPSPKDYNQSKLGIQNDWGIADRPEPFARRLVQLHEDDPDSGSYWKEFHQHHRRLFMDALNGDNPSLNEDGPSPEEIQSRLRDKLLPVTSKEAVIRQLTNLLQRNFNSTKEEFLVSRYPVLKRRLKHMGHDRHRRTFREMVKNRREGIVRQLVETLPDDSLRSLLSQRILGEPRIIIDYQQSRVFYPTGGQGGYMFELLGKDRVKISYLDSWIVATIKGDNLTEVDRYIEVNRHIPVEDKGLVPLMAWTKSRETGRRTYLSSEVPYPLNGNVDNQANTLLGLIVATYLSPKQRDMLPKKLGLKDGTYEQTMREAQVPLLVSMHSGEILNSPVFQAVESYVNRQMRPYNRAARFITKTIKYVANIIKSASNPF